MIEVSPLTPEEHVQVRLGSMRIDVEYIYRGNAVCGLRYILRKVSKAIFEEEDRVFFYTLTQHEFLSERDSCWGCLIDWG